MAALPLLVFPPAITILGSSSFDKASATPIFVCISISAFSLGLRPARTNYGLEIGQVAVSKIDYSETVKKQIAQQQKANMDIQTAKAQAAAAQQDAIKAEELGKAAAMTAKWEQEKVKAVEVTKAQQAYEVASLAAKEAMENAKKVKAEGDAEAFRQAA